MAWGRGIAVLLLAALLAAPRGASAQPVPEPSEQPETLAPEAAPIVVETPPPNGQAVLPVLTLDQDALYLHSLWGQRVQADLERRGSEIAAENERLVEQFAAEERELTALRQTLPPDEFRKRADEFDKRVVEVRRARDAAPRALQAEAEEERQAFFRAVLPVLAALMRERGAVVVLDQRAIFVASQSIDVTEELIDRIDREIGAGPLADPPQADAPEQAGNAARQGASGQEAVETPAPEEGASPAPEVQPGETQPGPAQE
ncbi:OmpH family outer membrane protein [Paracoccus sp. P2]|uniref:OmpH family outer membrane protein n=1 Tax=Paracoccus pantotrophus TaxID=82367 RepID=A0A1I5GGX2_PARPN|nr:OmpH family outer membrane protein [Paracoccus pantotrophus]MDF3854778.1 OmpH family outer membrane protein [Paracoccus pantotrophus]QFG35287.1 OmpH family outer membrane protein [Paracoccus pantotrophus]QLH13526.1 OmpH family outer membrane protein [Paracoccus pantotrophus]RDD96661.1 OmpH family outer membrane protein [Paracoccus pantotrophus]RKS44518.1 periplasmic chaperone for outer membrane proteins Skp [Paracoccus pantotrophus]